MSSTAPTSSRLRLVRLLVAALVAAAALALAGCAGTENKRDVGLKGVPLPAGTRITTSTRVCDRGANPFCSEQLVVVGDRYASSADLLNSLNARLHKLGWTVSRGETGKQLVAQPPGNELRLYFDTAYNDLMGLDTSQIRRSPPIGRALSATIFDRQSAVSLMVVRGSS